MPKKVQPKKSKQNFTMAHVWSSLDDDKKFRKHVRQEAALKK